MRYQFPNASHIDAYLAAVAGADEFFVKTDADTGIINDQLRVCNTDDVPRSFVI